MGAFVAGSRTLREFLINQARPFVFSTALPAYCAAQIRAALSLAAGAGAARRHLRELSARLRARLRATGFDVKAGDSQIVPLILGSNHTALRFAAALNTAGFAVRAIRPPTVPAGSARLRLSLHARLTPSNVDALADALAAVRDAEAVPE
jgi:8-amino-7-oxononanoate synthase